MDEVFLNKVHANNLDCFISKAVSAVSAMDAGFLPNDNFSCDLGIHSIIDSALDQRKILSDCQQNKIVNVYYHVTGT